LRPVDRVGMCMAPRTSGSCSRIRSDNHRHGSSGAESTWKRWSGERAATSRAFLAGSSGETVARWCESPIRDRCAASSWLGGVPRNSHSTTSDGRHLASWLAMPATRAPPPARMFQQTMRTDGRRSVHRCQAIQHVGGALQPVPERLLQPACYRWPRTPQSGESPAVDGRTLRRSWLGMEAYS
jgi:hypothetical protein